MPDVDLRNPVGFRQDVLCKGGWIMLSWAITFLLVAIIAAVLGFGGIAGAAVGFAKTLFVVCLVLFVIAFVAGRRPRY
jgi:uncharacterized membrane protein YtjA (UPF0391 family)